MRKSIKYMVITILLVAVVVAIALSDKVFASVAGNTESPINESESKKLSYNSIFSLVDPSQVRGDKVYIRYEDLIKFPSLLCAAHGYSLPGYNSTLVYGHDKTDNEKVTGYLTANDSGETVGWNEAQWTTSNTNTYHQVTSKTYGLFKVDGIYKATPAEAWVLSEMNKNDPKINSINFEITNQEYTGEVNDGNKVVTATGDELWAVEWDESSLEPTKFVTKQGNKYYYVTTDSYAPYTYVQHAWWKVKEIGKESKNSGNGIKDTDLAAEAEDFEKYMEKIAVLNSNPKENRDKWQYNDDNTIVVDYTKYINDQGKETTLGYDNTRAQVRFNSETNKYVVGPFKLNYLRAVTKQGSREKVSFSGISQTTLTAADANGNKLLDSAGNSVLQLGKNYRFVYDNETDHNNRIPKDKDGNTLDTNDDYPYPYDDEDFYIEIDYLDDMVSLVSLDIDFQYMNAGAEFQYLTGSYLIITWTPMAFQGQKIDDSSGNAVRENNTFALNMTTLDMSSRSGSNAKKYDAEEVKVSDHTREVEGDRFKLKKTEEDGMSDVIVEYTVKPEHKKGDTFWSWGYTYTCSEDDTVVKDSIDIELTYESGGEGKAKDINLDGNKITFVVPRNKTSPKEKVSIKIDYQYDIHASAQVQRAGGAAGGGTSTSYYTRNPHDGETASGTVVFYNKTVDGILISSPKGVKEGDTHKIDYRGNITESDLKVTFQPSTINGNLTSGGAYIWKDNRGVLSMGEKLTDDIKQSDAIYAKYMSIRGYDGTEVQKFTYNLDVPKMHLSSGRTVRYDSSSFIGTKAYSDTIYIYNHLGTGDYITNSEHDENDDGRAPLIWARGENGYFYCGSIPEFATKEHSKGWARYFIIDDAGTKIKIYVTANLTNPDNVKDKETLEDTEKDKEKAEEKAKERNGGNTRWTKWEPWEPRWRPKWKF